MDSKKEYDKILKGCAAVAKLPAECQPNLILVNKKKPTVIKKQTVEQLEENLYKEQISVVHSVFRWLKLKKPEKAKQLLKELEATT